jgi:hypothetical protein
MCSSPVRRFTSVLLRLLARLACIRRAASVRSEPGSNSQIGVYCKLDQGPPLQYTLHLCSTSSIQLSKNDTWHKKIRRAFALWQKTRLKDLNRQRDQRKSISCRPCQIRTVSVLSSAYLTFGDPLISSLFNRRGSYKVREESLSVKMVCVFFLKMSAQLQKIQTLQQRKSHALWKEAPFRTL